MIEERNHPYLFQNHGHCQPAAFLTEPNLQNIPSAKLRGLAEVHVLPILRAIWLVAPTIPKLSCVFLAHIADDKAIRRLSFGRCPYRNRRQVLVWRSGGTHEMRRHAKPVNFGIVYASGFFPVRRYRSERSRSKAYMERYFATFPVWPPIGPVVEEAKEQGYVLPLMGRRRWLPS